MAIANEKIVAGVGTLKVSWSITGPALGNAIIVKWRTTSSKLAWAVAPAQQLVPTATSYVITGLDAVPYDVQVGQVQFHSPQTVTGVKPIAPPPPPPAAPVNTRRPKII